MTRRLYVVVGVALLVFSQSSRPVSAQTIGTFAWQLQPFCNVLTLTVVQQGAVYLLDGFDNQCGAATRATASGLGALNPDGTIGFGIEIVTATGAAVHVRAVITLPSISGSWNDSGGNAGAFAFNANTGGSARPGGAHVGIGLSVNRAGASAFPVIAARRGRGTVETPAVVQSGDVLGRFDGQGFTGTAYSSTTAGVDAVATEAWTTTANGGALRFFTSANGGTTALYRLAIDHDGQVGIGTTAPLDRLDVRGDIRVGTGTTGCLRDADATILAGVCVSDARFKQDITPFDSTLDKLALLTPVHYRWRAAEFADRHFGTGRTYGLIAQDVERLFPDMVKTDAEGYRAVNYSKLPLLTLQAVKELKAENDALRTQQAGLEARLAALEAVARR